MAELFAIRPVRGEGVLATANGLKAEGLVAIPPEWRPAELLISVDLYREWLKDKRYLRKLPERTLPAFIQEACSSLGSHWLVRSSATNETVEDRGITTKPEIGAHRTVPGSINALGSGPIDVMCSI